LPQTNFDKTEIKFVEGESLNALLMLRKVIGFGLLLKYRNYSLIYDLIQRDHYMH